jgi:hypothetical protein
MASDVSCFPPRSSFWLLAAIGVAFVVVRGPLIYRQYGGQDEDCYAVPGLTVAREGIPRLPYAPARNRDSYFYRIDEALFCEPPASFYWQAPFFLVLPPGYGAARAASATAGLIAVFIVYQLGRRMLQCEAAGLWAAGLYSVSRLFFFPATTARPDMLCGLFGLAALLAAWSWDTLRRTRNLVIAGALLGLGMLTHPFAIVYCMQVGAWVLLASRGWQRLAAPALLAGCALAAFALWTPLIAAYPELFGAQFFHNIVNPAAPGIVVRMLVPWDSLRHHAAQLIEHAQIPQLALLSAGLLVSTALAWKRRTRGEVLLVSLAWSSCFLLSTAAGVRPSKGYWCFPGALLILCVAHAAVESSRWMTRLWVRAVGGACLVAVMLPGAGLRTWAAHLAHWNDDNYCAPRFVERMLADLPFDARLAVDPAFVLDVYAAGRPVLVSTIDERFFDVRSATFDYLIVGPVGRQKATAAVLKARILKAQGDPNDPFACYAQIYEPGTR